MGRVQVRSSFAGMLPRRLLGRPWLAVQKTGAVPVLPLALGRLATIILTGGLPDCRLRHG